MSWDPLVHMYLKSGGPPQGSILAYIWFYLLLYDQNFCPTMGQPEL